MCHELTWTVNMLHTRDYIISCNTSNTTLLYIEHTQNVQKMKTSLNSETIIYN